MPLAFDPSPPPTDPAPVAVGCVVKLPVTTGPLFPLASEDTELLSEATLLLLVLSPVDSEATPLCAVLMPVEAEVDSAVTLLLVVDRPVDSEAILLVLVLTLDDIAATLLLFVLKPVDRDDIPVETEPESDATLLLVVLQPGRQRADPRRQGARRCRERPDAAVCRA